MAKIPTAYGSTISLSPETLREQRLHDVECQVEYLQRQINLLNSTITTLMQNLAHPETKRGRFW